MSGIARALEAGTIEGGNKFITSLQSAKGLVDSGAIDRNGVIGGLGTGGFAGAGIRGEESRRTEGSKYLAGLEAKSRIAANETQGLGIQYGKMNEEKRIDAMSSIQAAAGMGFLDKVAGGKTLRENLGGVGLSGEHSFREKVLSEKQKKAIADIDKQITELNGNGSLSKVEAFEEARKISDDLKLSDQEKAKKIAEILPNSTDQMRLGVFPGDMKMLQEAKSNLGKQNKAIEDLENNIAKGGGNQGATSAGAQNPADTLKKLKEARDENLERIKGLEASFDVMYGDGSGIGLEEAKANRAKEIETLEARKKAIQSNPMQSIIRPMTAEKLAHDSALMNLEQRIGSVHGYNAAKKDQGANAQIVASMYGTQSNIEKAVSRVNALGGVQGAVSLDSLSAAVQAKEQKGAMEGKLTQSAINNGMDPEKAREFGKQAAESFAQTAKSKAEELGKALSGIQGLTSDLSRGKMAHDFANVKASGGTEGFVSSQEMSGTIEGSSSKARYEYYSNKGGVFDKGINQVVKEFSQQGKTEEALAYLNSLSKSGVGVSVDEGGNLVSNATALERASWFGHKSALSGIGQRINVGGYAIGMGTDVDSGKIKLDMDAGKTFTHEGTTTRGEFRSDLEEKIGVEKMRALDYATDAFGVGAGALATYKLTKSIFGKNKGGYGSNGGAPNAAKPKGASFAPAGAATAYNAQNPLDVQDFAQKYGQSSPEWNQASKDFQAQYQETLKKLGSGDIRIGDNGRGKQRAYDMLDSGDAADFMRHNQADFAKLDADTQNRIRGTINSGATNPSGSTAKGGSPKIRALKVGGGAIAVASVADYIAQGGDLTELITSASENLQGNWKANAGGNLAQQVSGTVADTFLTAAVSKSFVDYNRQKDKIAQQEWAKGNYGTAVWEKLKAGGVGLLGAAENTLNAAVDVAYMGSAAIESGFSDKTYAQVRAAQGDTSLTNIAGSIMQPSTPYSSGGQNNQVLNRMDDLEGFLQEFLSRQKKGE